MASEGPQPLQGLAIGAIAIAAVTGLIALLDRAIDADALTGLYLFAILPVAIVAGFWAAALIALASFLTFSYFFAAPVHASSWPRR